MKNMIWSKLALLGMLAVACAPSARALELYHTVKAEKGISPATVQIGTDPESTTSQRFTVNPIPEGQEPVLWTVRQDGTEKTKTYAPSTDGSLTLTWDTLNADFPDKKWNLNLSVSLAYYDYALTYHRNGGSGDVPESATYNYADSVTLDEGLDLSRTDCTFLGWATSRKATEAEYAPGATVTGADLQATKKGVTLYAVWKEKDFYTLTYYANEGSGSVPSATRHEYTEAYKLDEGYNITKTDCELLGWATTRDATEAEYALGQRVSGKDFPNWREGVTLYAVWRAKDIYTLTYYANGGSGSVPSATRHEYAEAYNLDEGFTISKTDCTLLGWATTRDATTAEFQCGQRVSGLDFPNWREGVRLYAVWKARDYYELTYYANGGTGYVTSSARHEFTESFTLDEGFTISLEGSDLLGWATTRDATTAEYALGQRVSGSDFPGWREGVRLYAVWKARDGYDLTYYANGGRGSLPSTTYHEYAESYDLDEGFDISKTDCELLGWATSREATAAEFACGQRVSGSDFPGWREGVKLYAVWGAKDYYTLTYYANGGTGSVTDAARHAYAETYSLDEGYGIKRSGYVFLGWATARDATEAEYEPGQRVSGLDFPNWRDDVTLYAVWQAEDQYTLTYFANGGSGYVTDKAQHKYDEAYDLDAGEDIRRTGYTLLGWSTSREATAAEYELAQRVTGADFPSWRTGVKLYAVWQPRTFVVSLNPNGGACDCGQVSATYDAHYDLPTPTRTGYAFKGWMGSTDYTIHYSGDTVKLTDDAVFIAQWTAMKWEVKLHWLDKADTVGSRQVGPEIDIKNVEVLPYDGEDVTFLGFWENSDGTGEQYWDSNGKAIRQTWTWEPVSNVWAKLRRYANVTFDANGGSVTPTEVRYALGERYETVAWPEAKWDEHHLFAGWFTQPSGGHEVLRTDPATEDVTALYAHWRGEEHAIAFHGYGATSGYMPDQTYDYLVAFTLNTNAFARTGHTFLGWAPNTLAASEGKVTYCDGQSLLSPSATDLYAVWSANDFTLVFDGNGAFEGGMTNQVCRWGESARLAPNGFARGLWTFLGWSRAPGATAAEFADGEEVSNLAERGTVTLYAVWRDDRNDMTKALDSEWVAFTNEASLASWEIDAADYKVGGSSAVNLKGAMTGLTGNLPAGGGALSWWWKGYGRQTRGSSGEKITVATDAWCQASRSYDAEARTVTVFAATDGQFLHVDGVTWTPDVLRPAPAIATNTVVFIANYEVKVPDQRVAYGCAATRPEDPVRSGYQLFGWFTDPDCAPDALWNFNAAVTGDLKLYAKWVARIDPVHPEDVFVTVTGHSATVTYDGEAHTLSGYDVAISDPRYTTADFDFIGAGSVTATAAGTHPLGLAESQFVNNSKTFTSVCFSVTDGALTIVKRAVDEEKIRAQAFDCTAPYTAEGTNGNAAAIAAFFAEEYGARVTYAAAAGGPWSDEAPVFAEIGEHTLHYRAVSERYADYEGTAKVTIVRGRIDDARVKAQGFDCEVLYTGVGTNGSAAAIAAFFAEEYGAVVTYATAAEGPWTDEAPLFADEGEHVLYFRAVSPCYEDYVGSAKVTIARGTIDEAKVKAQGFDRTLAYTGAGTVGGAADIAAFFAAEYGGTVAYAAAAGGPWSEEPPVYTNVGEHVLHYRVTSVSYADYLASAKVTIVRGTVDEAKVKAQGFDVTEPYAAAGTSGSAAAIAAFFAEEYGGTVTFAADAEGPWAEEPPVFTEVGEHALHYRVVSSNYEEYRGSARVTIVTGRIDDARVKAQGFDCTVAYTGVGTNGSASAIAAFFATEYDAAVLWSATAGGPWSEEAPLFTEVGEHVTHYRTVSDAYADYEGSATVTIVKGAVDEEKVRAQKFDCTAYYTASGTNGSASAIAAFFAAEYGAMVTWSTATGGPWQADAPTFSALGEHLLCYKAVSSRYADYFGSAKVTIVKGRIDAEKVRAQGFDTTETYAVGGTSGSAAAIAAFFAAEYGATVTWSRTAEGPWSDEPPTFDGTGEHVLYYKAVSEAYEDYYDWATVTVTPRDLALATVAPIAAQPATGSPVTPSVTVTDGGTVVPSANYAVAYADNVAVGTAYVTLTGRNNYTGTKRTTFQIVESEAIAVVPTAESFELPYRKSVDTAVGAYFTVTSASAVKSVTAKGLPAGVSLKGSAAGGYYLAGAPTRVGAFAATLTAKNVKGGTAGTTLRFTVYDGRVLTIACADSYLFTAGVAVEQEIAVESDADYTLTAKNLPSGLKLVLDKASGTYAITGTPSAPVTKTVTLTAKNKTNTRTATKAVTIAVDQGRGLDASGQPLPGIAVTATLASEGRAVEPGETLVFYAGVAQTFALDAAGLDGVATTLTAKGLPAGLSLKKTVTNKTTKAYCYTIAGTPTRAQAAKTVTVTASNKYKWTGSLAFDVVVVPLPTAAVGTYYGAVSNDTHVGQFTLTLGTTGRVSGKFCDQGKTYSFSAASLSRVVETEAGDDAFVATVSYKYAGAAVTDEILLAPNAAVTDYERWDASFAEPSLFWDDAWGVRDAIKSVYVTLPKSVVGTYALDGVDAEAGEYLNLKLAASGSVTVSGKLADRDGKLVSVSSSTHAYLEDRATVGCWATVYRTVSKKPAIEFARAWRTPIP